MDNFTAEQIEKAYQDFKRREYAKNFTTDNIAACEYAKFCIWCRAFKNADFSESNFKEYQQKEHTNFDFWLKKRIAELFFGYKFTFNYDTMKWQREKIKEEK